MRREDEPTRVRAPVLRMRRISGLPKMRIAIAGRRRILSVVRRQRPEGTACSAARLPSAATAATSSPVASAAAVCRCWAAELSRIRMSVLPVSRLSDCSERSFERRLDFICGAPSILPPALLAAIRHRRLQGRDPQMSVVWSEARVTRESIGLGNPPGWARASFVAYVAWNAAWMAVGRIPPSALRAILGIPCPTTGCTRSIVALVHGNLHASLAWNPFTTPILILLAVSLQALFVAGLRKKELILPRWMGNAWLGVLLAAWAAKFLLGPAYW